MTDDRSLERVIRSWLEEGPTVAPERPIDAAFALIDQTSQEWGQLAPWRRQIMHQSVRLAGAVVVATIAVAGAFLVFSGPGGSGTPPDPTPSPRSTDATPTAAASPSSPAPSGPIDTSSWSEYTSERYGLIISHPPDWPVRPSTHEWTLGSDFTDRGPEGFMAPDSSILVTVWSVQVPEGTTLEAWLEEYCQATTSPCTDLEAMAVPVYAEIRDRHEGVLIAFELDTQAFIPLWYDGTGSIWTQPARADLASITVVAAWRPDAPPYDARRLVEAFTRSIFLGVPGQGG